jgi:hypothetical protein
VEIRAVVVAVDGPVGRQGVVQLWRLVFPKTVGRVVDALVAGEGEVRCVVAGVEGSVGGGDDGAKGEGRGGVHAQGEIGSRGVGEVPDREAVVRWVDRSAVNVPT